jgi:hypothetical protein
LEDLVEPEPLLGEAICDPCPYGPELAFHHAGCFELAKPIREDRSADTGKAAFQLAVATGPLHQLLDDDQRPPFADHIQGSG